MEVWIYLVHFSPDSPGLTVSPSPPGWSPSPSHKTRVRVHSAWVQVHTGGVRVHKTRVRVRTRVWTRTRTHPLSPSPDSLQHCHTQKLADWYYQGPDTLYRQPIQILITDILRMSHGALVVVQLRYIVFYGQSMQFHVTYCLSDAHIHQ